MDRKYKNINNLGFNFDQASPYYITVNDNRPASSRAIEKNNNKIGQVEESRKISASRSSKAKSEMNYSKSGNSFYTASIKHRIDKACTTNSNSDLKKQNALLSRQIQKLEKEVLRKDQQIFQMKSQIMPNKQVQAELIQLYRALRYYQGKAKEMEEQIYKFRDLILKSPDEGVTAANLNILFEDLRKQNEELAAQYQQSEYMRASTENQYNRIRTKYLQSKRQLSEYKRFEVSPIYQYYKNKEPSKFNRIINQIVGKNAPSSMELKQKQMINKQLQQKIQDMEKQIQLIHEEMRKLSQQLSKSKAENFILQNQMEDKDKHITQLFTDYMNARKSLKKIQSQQNIPINRNQQFYTPTFKLNRYGSMQNV